MRPASTTSLKTTILRNCAHRTELLGQSGLDPGQSACSANATADGAESVPGFTSAESFGASTLYRRSWNQRTYVSVMKSLSSAGTSCRHAKQLRSDPRMNNQFHTKRSASAIKDRGQEQSATRCNRQTKRGTQASLHRHRDTRYSRVK